MNNMLVWYWKVCWTLDRYITFIVQSKIVVKVLDITKLWSPYELVLHNLHNFLGVMINETNLKNLVFAVCIVIITCNSWNSNFIHYLNITFLKWNTVQWFFCLPSQGEFSTIIELPEGEHEYKFCVDGRWIHDPNAVSTILIYKQKLLEM